MSSSAGGDPNYLRKLSEALDKFDPEGEKARAIAAKYHKEGESGQ
ncbi:MAG: hypothetical protein PHF35_04470 [Candidatus Moranbacteria bacterium]|nr:hypothetical protein [Candidatus Moranbacteria bacterium]